MKSYADFVREVAEYRSSSWTLIAANVLPLFGVLFWEWDTFSIVALYWFENVVIGAINVFKMVACNPDLQEIDESLSKSANQHAGRTPKSPRTQPILHAHTFAKVFLVPFFIFHYGLFCFVHGVFIVWMFSPEASHAGVSDLLSSIRILAADRHVTLAAAVLAGSHLFSFVRNYLMRGEYRRTIVIWLMVQPYARVIVLHVAILIGGIISMSLGSNMGVLVLLILGKTTLDLALHLRERARNAEKPNPVQSGEILDEAPRC